MRQEHCKAAMQSLSRRAPTSSTRSRALLPEKLRFEIWTGSPGYFARFGAPFVELTRAHLARVCIARKRSAGGAWRRCPGRDCAYSVRKPPTEAITESLRQSRSGLPMRHNFRMPPFSLRYFTFATDEYPFKELHDNGKADRHLPKTTYHTSL